MLHSSHVLFFVLVAGTPSPKAAVLANGDHGTEGEGTAGEWFPAPQSQCTLGQLLEEGDRKHVDRGVGVWWFLLDVFKPGHPPRNSSSSGQRSGCPSLFCEHWL